MSIDEPGEMEYLNTENIEIATVNRDTIQINWFRK